MNTWLHSTIVVLLGAILLVSVHILSTNLVGPPIYTSSDLDPWMVLFAKPLQIATKLIPGLVIGFFTRRHPLVVGAVAGLIASYSIPLVVGYRLFPFAQGGDAIAFGLVIAVAALAGRALRYRFQPDNRPQH